MVFYPRRRTIAKPTYRKAYTKIAAKAKTNKPVMVARAKAKAPVKKNTNAITTLARQVRNLQVQRYGFLQYQEQHLLLKSGPHTHAGQGTMGPTYDNPVAFTFNAFRAGTPLYYGDHTAGVAAFHNLEGAPNSVGDTTYLHWAKHELVSSLNHEYDWTARNNKDSVSATQYLPVFAGFRMNIKQTMEVNEEPVMFNLKLIKVQKTAVDTSLQKYSLPGALGAYYGLCSHDLNIKRNLSKKYHKVLFDKTMYFNPPQGGTGAKVIQNKSMYIPWAFNQKKPCRMDFADHAQGGTQQFWTAEDQDSIIWCILSTNQGSWNATETANRTEISMRRYLKWRDDNGVWGGA